MLISSPCNFFKHCISVLYRSPSFPVSFFDNFCTTLQFLSPHRFTSFVLFGDFNINFKNKDLPYFCSLQSILQNFSLSQVVHSPTHVNTNGHTSLIDMALVSSCSVITPLQMQTTMTLNSFLSGNTVINKYA